MKPELVVFDMAGTTVKDKNYVHAALIKAMSTAHVTIAIEDANRVMGYPKPVAISQLFNEKSTRETTPSSEEVLKVHNIFLTEMISFYRESDDVSEKDNATSIFKTLRSNGIKVAIDTGFDRSIANTIFEKLGWKQGETFDFSVTSDEVENGRPHADMVLKAMEQLNINKSSAVAKIGDTASDIQEGNAANCGWVIGITNGAFSREDLEKEDNTHLVDTLEELPALFGV